HHHLLFTISAFHRRHVFFLDHRSIHTRRQPSTRIQHARLPRRLTRHRDASDHVFGSTSSFPSSLLDHAPFLGPVRRVQLSTARASRQSFSSRRSAPNAQRPTGFPHPPSAIPRLPVFFNSPDPTRQPPPTPRRAPGDRFAPI
ncbi:hypothetical protein C8R47DRAFT_1327604, partial [Mycena vitilis]